MRGANFTKICDDLARIHNKFVLAFGYDAVFSNAGGSKLSDVENKGGVGDTNS